MNRILPLVILVAACKGDGRSQPAPTRAPAPMPALEHATQADLVHDIADADRLGTWRELQQRWQGQTLRWTVTRQRALCSSAADCNVAALSAAASRLKSRVGGLLPILNRKVPGAPAGGFISSTKS